MASVTIQVPDALVPRLTTALRATFPEHDALGVTAAFKAATADYWRGVLTDYETRLAEQQAQAANVAAIKAAAAAFTSLSVLPCPTASNRARARYWAKLPGAVSLRAHAGS